MSLWAYLLLVLVVGVGVSLICSFVPDDYLKPAFKRLLVGAAILVLVLVLLFALLGGGHVGDVKIPSLR